MNDRNLKMARFSFATRLSNEIGLPNLSKEEKSAIDASIERAKYLDMAQSLNGPGFYIDKKIREFLKEYNNRVFLGKGSEQPSSFQILRDFVEPDNDSLVLKLNREEFYVIDSLYILEKITNPEIDNDIASFYALEEGTIYQVSIPGSHESLQITGRGNIATYGFAFIRHNEEISFVALGAKDLPEKGEEKINLDETKIDPNRDFLNKNKNDISLNKIDFYDLKNLYPVIFLARFDISKKSTMVRYVLEELEDAFQVHTDDRQMYTGLVKGFASLDYDSTSNIFDNSQEIIKEYSEVFSLMLEIPGIVISAGESEDLTTSRYPTEIFFQKGNTNYRKMKSILSPEESRNFATVKSIFEKAYDEKEYTFDSKVTKIEQNGYWRNLDIGKIGVGKNGDKVFGKTWVTVSESWVESFGFEPPENSSTVTLRAGSDSRDIGELYVMRSALHPRDTYKVGFTTKTSDERASQLQSTSGQPDQFNVVQSWHVKSPRKVESLIHQKIAAHRINSNREFFQIKYQKLREVIEAAIAELNADAD